MKRRALFESKQHRRLLFLIASGSVVIRLIAVVLFRFDMDEGAFEFEHIAQNLAAGNGFWFNGYGDFPEGPTAWEAPLYAFILAGYMLLFGNNLIGMAFIQTMIAGLTCWGLGVYATWLVGPAVGLLTASVFALYPEMIFMPLKYVAEPWLLAELILFLLIGFKYFQTEKVRYVILCGLIAGIAALTKESALIFPLVLMVWMALKKRLTSKIIRDTVLMVVVMLAVIAPWTIRNYKVFDEFVLIRTNFWTNLWRGNHPGATGCARGFDKELIDFSLDPDYSARLHAELHGNEVQREQAHEKFAFEFIRQNPGKYVNLSLRRFIYFWTVDPTHPMSGNILYWLPWIFLSIFALVGGIITRHRWKDFSFWYLLFAIMTVVYSLMLVLPRYRIPLLPGVMLLAAAGLHWLLTRNRETRDA
ncbi:MAG: glycosyltransferase family 39 protein [bacterium]